MPELIADQVSGFLVDDLDQACEAVMHVSKINRVDCRRHVEENFTVDLMVDRYIKVYEQIT